MKPRSALPGCVSMSCCTSLLSQPLQAWEKPHVYISPAMAAAAASPSGRGPTEVMLSVTTCAPLASSGATSLRGPRVSCDRSMATGVAGGGTPLAPGLVGLAGGGVGGTFGGPVSRSKLSCSKATESVGGSGSMLEPRQGQEAGLCSKGWQSWHPTPASTCLDTQAGISCEL